MPTPTTTLEGRLTEEPQRNQRNPNLVEFTIAEGTRYQDRQTGEWKDGSTLFARCKVWDAALGNNILATLHKGMDVVALADVKQNSWTDKQTGQNRSMVEFTVTNIGVGLRRATAQVMPNPKRGGGFNGNGQQYQNPANPPAFPNPNGATAFQNTANVGTGGVQTPMADPWGAAARTSGEEEPEF